MAGKTLDDLYMEGLRDMYNAEKQILKALPQMSKAASSNQLRQAFDQHFQQTQHQVERLDQVFQMLNQQPREKKCMGMQGIIQEGQEMMQAGWDPEVLDAALIAAAQKVEHYEMAAYGTLRTWAHDLGHDREADLLQQTLNEEGDTDHKLTQIAESRVNMRAEKGR